MWSCDQSPDFEKIKSALKYFPDGEERWTIIKRAGKIEKIAGGKEKKFHIYPESRHKLRKCEIR